MQAYIPENLKAENNRLMIMVNDLKEDMTIEEFIDKNASEEYKSFIEKKEKRKKKLLSKGVIQN